MKRTKHKKMNNSGLSLIELVVSIAIFSIASVAIFEFVMVAIRHYQKGTSEVEVQYEAQLAMNQLQDLLIDANRGVTYMVNGSTAILSDAEIADGTVTDKQVFIYNADRYYVIEWIAAEREILYSEYIRNADGSWVADADAHDALLAEYVREFSVDLSSVQQNNCIELKIYFDNDREYQVTQNVKLRNKVSVNAPLAEMYGG